MSGRFGRPAKLAHRLDDPNKKRTEDVINKQNQDKTFHDLHLKDAILKGVLAAGFKRYAFLDFYNYLSQRLK